MENEMLSEYANYLNKHYMSGGNNIDNYLINQQLFNRNIIVETIIIGITKITIFRFIK